MKKSIRQMILDFQPKSELSNRELTKKLGLKNLNSVVTARGLLAKEGLVENTPLGQKLSKAKGLNVVKKQPNITSIKTPQQLKINHKGVLLVLEAGIANSVIIGKNEIQVI